MAYRRDYRNCGAANRAGNFFCVERPEILGRAAATSDDQHVHQIQLSSIALRLRMMVVNEFDGPRDVTAGAFTLHPSGGEEHMNSSRAPRDNVQNVANGGTGRRSDDSNSSGKNRQ